MKFAVKIITSAQSVVPEQLTIPSGSIVALLAIKHPADNEAEWCFLNWKSFGIIGTMRKKGTEGMTCLSSVTKASPILADACKMTWEMDFNKATSLLTEFNSGNNVDSSMWPNSA